MEVLCVMGCDTLCGEVVTSERYEDDKDFIQMLYIYGQNAGVQGSFPMNSTHIS